MLMKREYMLFYFEGRDEPLDQDDLDVDKLAELALAGPDDPYTVVRRAVEAVAAPLHHDRDKREWMVDYRDEIEAAGGDGEAAYEHFVKGRIDETIAEVEEDVLEVMDPRQEEDDEEDDDDEDEDEDDDDDE